MFTIKKLHGTQQFKQRSATPARNIFTELELSPDKETSELIEENTLLKSQLSIMNEKMEKMMEKLDRLIPSVDLTPSSNLKDSPNSDIFSPKISSPYSTSNLMADTAKITQDLSILEKNAPKLIDNSSIAFWKFWPLYLQYTLNGGNKKLEELIQHEPTIYYQRIFENKLTFFSSLELGEKLKDLHQSKLDAATLLSSNLTMENLKVYDKTKTELYLQLFTNLLDRYDQIEEELSGKTIVSILFKNLQPASFSTEMQLLQIETINAATRAISAKMSRKDIAKAENSINSSTINPIGNPDNKKKGCFNCNSSKDSNVNKNHSIWKCRNIDYCCKCGKKHLALGPSCPFKDIKIFNYEKYLEQKKNPIDQPINNNGKYPGSKGISSDSYGNSFLNFNDINSYSPSILSIANTTQIVHPTPLSRDDLDRQMILTMQIVTSELKKFNGSQVRSRHTTLNQHSIIIDTGANMTGIRTTSHSDSPVILNRMEDRTSDDQIQVADGSFIPIEGSGTLLNHTTGLISQFQNTLLSVNRTNVSNNAIAIFTETDCHVIKLNKQILNILYKLLNKAKSSNSILLNGDVVNGLYICEIDDIEKSPSLNTCTFRYNTSHDINAPIYDDINLPTSNHIKRANSSYYSNVPSVHLDSLKELVRYFHEAWNHASSELMCLIIKHQLILNLPPQLTEKVVRKYHPNCNACPAGNLQRRPFMSLPVTRYMEEGEEWECDIMGPFTDKNGKRCRTFSGNLYALTCKDLKTRKRQGYLLKNKGYLLRYIKHLITFNSLHNRTIRILRMDDEFYTQEILDYLAIKHILPLNCIPHEHETLGNSERDNRTIREVVLKNLADKPHLDERYWGMCYKDILSKMDLMPCPDDPTNNPYLLWFKKKFDLLRQPTIPFGSIVRAHVPLAQQSMLKERSIITYYVGYNNDRHGGILLFNPKTKQTIIRKSYRVMGPIIQPNSTISYEAHYEEDE